MLGMLGLCKGIFFSRTDFLRVGKVLGRVDGCRDAMKRLPPYKLHLGNVL